MSTLNIRFANDFNFYSAAEAQAPVEVIGPAGTVARKAMTLGRGLEIDLPEGKYLVRLFLPSGEIVAEQADVGGGVATVRLQSAQESPQESLAWAYYLKGAARGELAWLGGSGIRVIKDSGPHPQLLVWHRRSNAAASADWAATTAGNFMIEDHTPAVQDQHLRSVVTVSCDYGVQVWLQIHSQSYPTKFVALPGFGAVQVVIRQGERPATAPDPLTVLVQMGNQRAEALLNYLARGAFVDAALVGDGYFETARDLLAGKVDDPFGAAIAGYFLLRAGRVTQFHQWIANLDELMPWLPDGAVIHAWHLRQQSQSDQKRFRNGLLEAERRGLPMFTQGVRLLYDGLRALNRGNENDFDVEHALGRLSDYAAALDWSAPTTTFYANHPDKPLRPLPTTN